MISRVAPAIAAKFSVESARDMKSRNFEPGTFFLHRNVACRLPSGDSSVNVTASLGVNPLNVLGMGVFVLLRVWPPRW